MKYLVSILMFYMVSALSFKKPLFQINKKWYQHNQPMHQYSFKRSKEQQKTKNNKEIILLPKSYMNFQKTNNVSKSNNQKNKQSHSSNEIFKNSQPQKMYYFTKFSVYIPYFILTYYPIDSMKNINTPFKNKQKSKNDAIYDNLFISSTHSKSLKNPFTSDKKRAQKEFQLDQNLKVITLFQILNKTNSYQQQKTLKINLTIGQEKIRQNRTSKLSTEKTQLSSNNQNLSSKNNITTQNSSLNLQNTNTSQNTNNSTNNLPNNSNQDYSISSVSIAPVTIQDGIEVLNQLNSFNLTPNNRIQQQLLPQPSVVPVSKILSKVLNNDYQTNNPIIFTGQASSLFTSGIQSEKLREFVIKQDNLTQSNNIQPVRLNSINILR